MNRVRSVVAAVGVLTALFWTGCHSMPWSDGAMKEPAVTVTADRMPLELSVPAKGYLEALKASPVAVPRVPTGALKVKELVLEGSIVEAGQIVVVFDDTSLNLELENHRASFRATNRHVDRVELQSGIELGSIEVMRDVANLELENFEAFRIVDDTIYSRQEILQEEVRQEEASETILFADASLLLRGEYFDIEQTILGVEQTQVEGKIGRVETSLGSLVLKAPIGGMIVYKKSWRGSSVAVGDSLWPGNVIMSIVDPASCALTGFVQERDAASLEVGSNAEVVVDAIAGRRFQGRVETVAEISRPIERGSPVKYTEVRVELLDGDPALLRPGMKGEAWIDIGRIQDAVVVPRSAIHGEAGAPFVLLEQGATSERRAVTLGPGDLVRVSIEQGLDGGERVLLDGDSAQPGTDAERAGGA